MQTKSILYLCLLSTAAAFVVTSTKPPNSKISSSVVLQARIDIFTGGVLDGKEDEAAKVASRIKSVKDLGWTAPPKRKGSTRPRHRAYGGEDEEPVQSKPNYDESNPNCVEKWLTQDELESRFRISGPVADTIFVALAGGAAFAERDVCERILAEWTSDKSFNERAFYNSVQKGRLQLASGWLVFGSVVSFAGLGILLPTNPAMKAFENLVAQVQQEVLPNSPYN